jgi:hypothetical protein
MKESGGYWSYRPGAQIDGNSNKTVKFKINVNQN